MLVVDASVWVSALVPTEPQHATSRSWLRARVHRGDFILEPALAGAVATRTGRSDLGSRAVSLLQGTPNMRIVPVDSQLSDLSARTAAALLLKGADAVYVALASSLDVPLVTWDQDMHGRGSGAANVIYPKQVNGD